MKNKEQLTSKKEDISLEIDEHELAIKKNNGLGIVWQCIGIIMFLVLFSFCSYEFFMIIFDGSKSTDLKTLFIVMSFMLFCALLLGLSLYLLITQVIAENFSIKLYKDYFVFKSIFINKKVTYEDIKDVYIIDRGKEERSLFSFIKYRKTENIRYRYNNTKVLKIRRKKGFNLFICLNLLDKKEELLLRGILKQKLGKKIREKLTSWE